MNSKSGDKQRLNKIIGVRPIHTIRTFVIKAPLDFNLKYQQQMILQNDKNSVTLK